MGGGEGRNYKNKGSVGQKSKDRKRITSESEKHPVLFTTQYPETLLSNPFSVPRLGFVSRQRSFTRQSEPISRFSPLAFFAPLPSLALCQLWHSNSSASQLSSLNAAEHYPLLPPSQQALLSRAGRSQRFREGLEKSKS